MYAQPIPATIRDMIVQVLFSGFTQHRGYAHGWYVLRERLLQQGYSNGIDHRVWLEPWRANTKNLAISLKILQGLYGKVHLGIYGYSYGGGFGAMQLTRRLAKFDIRVQKLVLADPVFRPAWIPVPLPSPLSLLPFNHQPKIRLPDNIVDLVHFYQNENCPQSPYLITDSVRGYVEHRQLNVPHQKVDDHPHVHRAIMQCAEELRLESQNTGLRVLNPGAAQTVESDQHAVDRQQTRRAA